MKILGLILRTMGVLFALFFGLYLVFLIWVFRMPGPNQCRKGPLAEVARCDVDHAFFNFQGSGWFYTKGEGKVDSKFCGTDQREILTDDLYAPLVLVEGGCLNFLSDSRFVRCYARSMLSRNGNTTYFGLFAVDSNCQMGLYFQGSRRALLKDKIVESNGDDLKGSYPYHNLLEEK